LLPKTGHIVWLLPVLFLLLSGCSYHYEPIVLEGQHYPDLEQTPFFPQKAYQCGPASLASLLNYSGANVDPDDLVPLVYVPKRRGSFQVELIAATRTYERIPYVLNPSINALAAELMAGRPVLVLQNYGLTILPFYHFAVVIGLLPDERIILHSGQRKRHIMKTDQFLMSWLRTGAWAMVVLRPGELPEGTNFARYLQAVSDFEKINGPESALPAYRAAVLRWPENSLLLFAMGNNSLKRNDLVEAISYFRQALKQDENHLGAINNLADALAKQGCLEEARELIENGVILADQQGSAFGDVINKTLTEIEKLAEHRSNMAGDSVCK